MTRQQLVTATSILAALYSLHNQLSRNTPFDC